MPREAGTGLALNSLQSHGQLVPCWGFALTLQGCPGGRSGGRRRVRFVKVLAVPWGTGTAGAGSPPTGPQGPNSRVLTPAGSRGREGHVRASHRWSGTCARLWDFSREFWGPRREAEASAWGGG